VNCTQIPRAKFQEIPNTKFQEPNSNLMKGDKARGDRATVLSELYSNSKSQIPRAQIPNTKFQDPNSKTLLTLETRNLKPETLQPSEVNPAQLNKKNEYRMLNIE
jgi:hypothetical protein